MNKNNLENPIIIENQVLVENPIIIENQVLVEIPLEHNNAKIKNNDW